MMQLAEAANAMHGELRGNDVAFDAVSADSRTIRRGDLFVALRGDRFDGHRFVGQAALAGAAAAVVERGQADGLQHALPLAAVADTTIALGDLASDWRRRFDLPLIAVAGSNGKTTVKEMIAACLREAFGADRVLSTLGNFNNHIGLPLTLLRLRRTHRAAVVEIGMNHPGETALLAAIAQPVVALVNNAQREHQEFMKTVDDVAREHGTLFASLPPDGIAVINADDPHAGYWRDVAGARAIRDFGLGEAHVRATCRPSPTATALDVRTADGGVSFTLPVAGMHNARNALAAIAASTAAGAGLDACARALAAFAAVSGRLQAKAGIRGTALIDDTYNANPDSARAAIDVLARGGGRKLFVLGDMGEVGAHGPAFHHEIGAYAKAAGVDRLYTLGELSAHAAQAFGAGGRHYPRVEDLLADLDRELGAGATLLVKGSRFMKMERVVGAFARDTAQAAGDSACS